MHTNWRSILFGTTAIIRAVAPELNPYQLCIVPASFLPDDVAAMRGHCHLGWTQADLLPRLSPFLGTIPAQGFACIINAEAIEAGFPRSDWELAARSVVLHETAHVFNMDFLQHWRGQGRLSAAAALNFPLPPVKNNEGGRVHHGPDFLRAASHLVHRFLQCGRTEEIAVNVVLGGLTHPAADPLAYVEALTAEYVATRGRPLDEILETDPPAAFTAVWLKDRQAEREADRLEREQWADSAAWAYYDAAYPANVKRQPKPDPAAPTAPARRGHGSFLTPFAPSFSPWCR